MTAKLTLVQKAVVLAAAAAVFLVNGRPSEMLREAVLTYFGKPAYEGVWILIPHLFLYSTLTAAVALVAWLVFSRMGWIARPWFAGLNLRTAAAAVVVGLALAAVSLGYLKFAMPQAVHGFEFDPWVAFATCSPIRSRRSSSAASCWRRLRPFSASGRARSSPASPSRRSMRSTRSSCRSSSARAAWPGAGW